MIDFNELSTECEQESVSPVRVLIALAVCVALWVLILGAGYFVFRGILYLAGER